MKKYLNNLHQYFISLGFRKESHLIEYFSKSSAEKHNIYSFKNSEEQLVKINLAGHPLVKAFQNYCERITGFCSAGNSSIQISEIEQIINLAKQYNNNLYAIADNGGEQLTPLTFKRLLRHISSEVYAEATDPAYGPSNIDNDCYSDFILQLDDLYYDDYMEDYLDEDLLLEEIATHTDRWLEQHPNYLSENVKQRLNKQPKYDPDADTVTLESGPISTGLKTDLTKNQIGEDDETHEA